MDAALGLQKRFPAGSVVKYAARSLSTKLTKDSVSIFVKYMLHIAADAPIVLPILADVVRRLNHSVSTPSLDAILARQVLFRRSDSACWTLYIYGLCGVAVSDTLADSIIASRDCMAMAALLAIKQHESKVTAFVKRIDKAVPYDIDQYWLLVHELQASVPEAGYSTYAEQSGLKLLNDEGVSFLRAATMDADADEDEDEPEVEVPDVKDPF
ncbi:MAG: hypothetical protein LW650_15120 [Planctomycetaceae bacterium]|jgi:hypothetical protein|nr:hypothetical protein [Phycisphaerales bacterium]MCE2654714.1 hypothetical protein [Planctomycetaceae bacterium]